MENNLYPLRNIFNPLINGATIIKISLPESIRQHLQILLSTRLNEYIYDRSYGCELLNNDFSILETEKEIEILIKFIKESICNHEQRVDPATIIPAINIKTEEKNFTLRKKMYLNIQMLTKKDQIPLDLDLEYYLSPFAII